LLHSKSIKSEEDREEKKKFNKDKNEGIEMKKKLRE
jgi:hypothetical protein